MNEEILELNVLQVKQKIGTFFISSISAKDLVGISYSDVRRLVSSERDFERYLGIQRPVKTKRIKDIKKYLEGSDATFPTAVILAVDERCAEYQAGEGGCGKLVLKPSKVESDDEDSMLIPYSRIAKVIDGQHRIAAFMDENNNWNFSFDEDDDFEINVAIFVGADVADQANIFATVNLAQTKVNRSLVYDLTELSRAPSPYKTCHNVAVMLDREKTSPFYKRIKRLGTKTPGRENETITQQSFVESLVKFISVDPIADRNALLDGKRLRKPSGDELDRCPFRNLFLEGKEIDIAEILYNYFSAVRSKWPESWESTGLTGNLLPRANAFKALMKYLLEDVYKAEFEACGSPVPSAEAFSAYFHQDLTDEDFTARNFVPGSGGQSTFLAMLRGEKKRADLIV